MRKLQVHLHGVITGPTQSDTGERPGGTSIGTIGERRQAQGALDVLGPTDRVVEVIDEEHGAEPQGAPTMAASAALRGRWDHGSGRLGGLPDHVGAARRQRSIDLQLIQALLKSDC